MRTINDTGNATETQAKLHSMEVSYCLFTYNQAPFIREALHSAFRQDYSPLEIVIVDDGSTDGTAEIIRTEVAEYTGPHQIKLSLKETNKGLADSVNAAIYDLSHGDWLVFAAGDDISSSDRVSKVASLSYADPKLTIIQTGVTRIDADGHFLDELQPPSLSLEDSASRSALGAAAAYHRCSIALFPKIGNRVIREDVVLTTRALLVGRFGRIEDRLVQWRRHDNNISGRIGKSFLERMAFSRGKFAKAHSVALAQQTSDITHAMMQGRLDVGEGIRLLLLFTNQIRKHYRRGDFFDALASKTNLGTYIFWHPLNGVYGCTILFSLYVREKVFNLRQRIFS